jgi:N-acetylmuramoyl-L-alanine amidase
MVKDKSVPVKIHNPFQEIENRKNAEIEAKSIPKMSRGMQTTIPYTKEEVELMAHVVWAESRGESFEGMIGVTNVILNRLKNPDFPKTIEAIVYQKGQFECVKNRQINLKPEQIAYEAVMVGIKEDRTKGSLFYWNWKKVKNAKKLIGYKELTIRIEDHQFAK